MTSLGVIEHEEGLSKRLGPSQDTLTARSGRSALRGLIFFLDMFLARFHFGDHNTGHSPSNHRGATALVSLMNFQIHVRAYGL